MSRAKQKGTAAESAVVRYLREQGWDAVERRTLCGVKDRGDVAGLPGIVLEIKDHAAMSLAGWVDEAQVEKINDDARIGIVWHKRRGRGSPADWYVTMTGAGLVLLLQEGGW